MDLEKCIQDEVERQVKAALAKVSTGSSSGAVIIRARDAGVHVGYLKSRKDREVVLTDARRVWYWNGANTLHEMSLHGVSKGSKISEPVPEILVMGVIEVLPCTDKALKSFSEVGWDK